MDIIGIIGLIIGVFGIILGIIPYYRSKYVLRPEVTIEMVPNGGFSAPRGFSTKNEVNAEGYIDGNNAIQIFELTWKFDIKITNNSDFTAFYPELEFNPNGPTFKIDEINRLEPIKPAESLKLKAEFNKYEEVTGKNRTQVGKAPPTEFKNLELLFGYENSKKRRFYTLFDFNLTDDKNKFLRSKPKHYGNN
jgi:hypothetical protein